MTFMQRTGSALFWGVVWATLQLDGTGRWRIVVPLWGIGTEVIITDEGTLDHGQRDN